jgi:hypothetical protein
MAVKRDVTERECGERCAQVRDGSSSGASLGPSSRANVKKRRPGTCLGERRVGEDVLGAGSWLANVLDDEAGIEEQRQPGMEGTMNLMEREGHPVALDVVDGAPHVEVTALNSRLMPEMGRCKWMNDRSDEASARDEYARSFTHGRRSVVHVLQRHERDEQVERGIREWECRSVRDHDLLVGTRLRGESGQ